MGRERFREETKGKRGDAEKQPREGRMVVDAIEIILILTVCLCDSEPPSSEANGEDKALSIPYFFLIVDL